MTTCCSVRLYGLAALLFIRYTSALSQSSVCYGNPFLIPKHLFPPSFQQKIYYTPTYGLQRLVVDKGKSLDPLFVFLPDPYSTSHSGWTHEDEGTILVPSLDEVISISVADCKDPRRKRYGDSISWLVMSGTQFVQFVPSGSSVPVVLWNHTGPSPSRGVMEGYRYALFHLTQKDSGYYNFRGAHNKLMWWTKLEVTNYKANLSHYTGDVLHYKYPFTFTEWKARAFPHRSNDHLFDLDTRVKMSASALDIQSVEMRDAGLYEFVDYEDNVMLQIILNVTHRAPHPGIIFWTIVVLVFLLMFFCCCYVRKCRVKKKCKNSENGPEPSPEPTTNTAPAPPAGPAVYYHHSGHDNPHMETAVTGQTTAPGEPTVNLSEPPSFSTAIADLNPPPKFQVSGGFGTATASPEPQFNIRGMTFPSAPPLSEDTSTSDTYTSEKINFL